MAANSTDRELLSMIQTSARNGTLLPSCAPEVKELMVQIDTLISGSQREWERSARQLHTQLQQRDRDIATLKVQLKERNAQVEHLRQKSSALTREYKTQYTDYESQLEQLRSEVSRLTKAYSHLRARRGAKVSRPPAVIERGGAPLDEMTRESRELRESVAVLQETVMSKDQMIRALQEELSFAHSSAQATSCQTDLCQAQQTLRTQLILDKALREELRKLKDATVCVNPCHKEELGQRLGECVREIGQGAPTEHSGHTSEHLESAVEHILEKHFDQLDSSIQQMFLPRAHT